MSGTKNKKQYWLSGLFLIVMTAVTVYLLLREVDLDEMFNLLFSVDLKFILLGMGFVAVYFFCEGSSFRSIINSLDNKISYRKAFVYSCINSFYSFTTPFGTGGQPFTIYYMMNDGIPGTKVSVTTLVNLLDYKLVMIAYSIIVAVVRPALVFEKGAFIAILFIISMIVNVFMVLLVALSLFNIKLIHKIGEWCLKLLSKIGFIKKNQLEAKLNAFYAHAEEYRNGALHIKNNPIIFIRSLLWCFGQRAASFIVTYMVFLSFRLDAGLWIDVLAAQALIYITVDSLPLPGGVGVTEKLFLTLYGTIYAANVITPAVLLTRVVNYVFALLLSGIFAFYKQITVMKGHRLNA